jgi:hypothetical protein
MFRLHARVDLPRLIGRVDVNQLMGKVDVDELVERTELGALIADSTSSVAQRVLDSLRSRTVALDDLSNRVVNRLLRRTSADIPHGPPGFIP